MKNKLVDLNNYLFAQIERLSDEDLTSDQLDTEIKRSKQISLLAGNVIDNARIALKAMVAINENLIKQPPAMLGEGWTDEEKAR